MDASVNILDDYQRLTLSLKKELPQLAVAGDNREIKIINVKLEEISHGGYQARLPCSRRTIDEVPSFPRPSSSLVVFFMLEKLLQIIDNVHLSLKIHG